MIRCRLLQICGRSVDICYLLLLPWSWRRQMKCANSLILLRIFWRKSTDCRRRKQTSVSQNLPPRHWDIRVKKALVARHKGSFTPSTGVRDVLKTFTTRQLLRNARKCSLKCQSNALTSSAGMANFASGRPLLVPMPKCTNSTTPGWNSRYRSTGKKKKKNRIAEHILFFCRSQWTRGLRRRSATARLLRLWVRIPPEAWMYVCCERCVLSLRRADHSSKGVLPIVVLRWVWSRNLVNAEALAHLGLPCQKKNVS